MVTWQIAFRTAEGGNAEVVRQYPQDSLARPSTSVQTSVEALPLIGRRCLPVFVGAIPEWRRSLDPDQAQLDKDRPSFDEPENNSGAHTLKQCIAAHRDLRVQIALWIAPDSGCELSLIPGSIFPVRPNKIPCSVIREMASENP